jgi:hypothetical protein
MAALIEVEQDVPVAPLLEELLDFRIGVFERLAQIFYANVQLCCVLLDLSMEGRDVRFQDLNDIAAGVIEYKKTLDLDRARPLSGAM